MDRYDADRGARHGYGGTRVGDDTSWYTRRRPGMDGDRDDARGRYVFLNLIPGATDAPGVALAAGGTAGGARAPPHLARCG